ncbi:MAG: hypothetical protein EBZ49_08780 [Proteobacteria bacterium]|nr:hypothetical protein [Pseudomonadota bacterium]
MAKDKITSSSTAEYFSKNLQQVGFSSPTKAVLTTLKEAVDNSLEKIQCFCDYRIHRIFLSRNTEHHFKEIGAVI